MSTFEGLIAVIPSPRTPGIGPEIAPDEGRTWPPRAEVVLFEEAFARRWETDAHFLLYMPEPYDPAEPFFRLRKSALPTILKRGGRVLVQVIAIDWDTPGHVPWTDDLLADFTARIAEARRGPFGARLAQAAVFYTTRKGARWVFRLEKPLSAEKAEPYIWGLQDEFVAAGLEVDRAPVVGTWTQPFRLPRVSRAIEAPEKTQDEDVAPADENAA